jgi:16S rRNA G527 N7-methylase RsmG
MNVTTICCRSEDYDNGSRYDYILGRAVSNINDFVKKNKFLLMPSGKILYLNGVGENSIFSNKSYPLSDIFEEDYFSTKQLMIFENIYCHNL